MEPVDVPLLKSIADGITDKLREEIQILVDAKYLIDDLARTTAGARLATSFHGGTRGPMHGTDLFRRIFPFSRLEDAGEDFSALVPTAQTIGASHRWRTEDLSETERASRLEFYRDPARSEKDAWECAQYIWIKPLGLFLAHEGKNRVGLFRRMQVDQIPALVSPYNYPSPDRLAIYRVTVGNSHAWWAVLDDTLLEPIRHPDWALPVLRAYGVKVYDTWPYQFPKAEAVMLALRFPKTETSWLPATALNLDDLLKQCKFQEEKIPCAVADIKGIDLPIRVELMIGCASIITLLFAFAVPGEWQKLQLALTALAAAGFGVMVAFALPVVRVPRRLADGIAIYKKFGQTVIRSAGIKIDE